MPRYEKHGSVHVILLDDGLSPDDECRLSPDRIDAVHRILDDIEATEGPGAVVTASSTRFFSNGLDLGWALAHPDRWASYLSALQRLLARVLVLPLPTVAAVPGHAFGAGAMLLLAHDRRIMRDDRGYVCFPEVDIHVPVTDAMSDLLRARMTPNTLVQALTTGRRYGGADAVVAGIVDETAPLDTLMDRAIAYAETQAGKRSPTLGDIKRRLYRDVLPELLRDLTVEFPEHLRPGA